MMYINDIHILYYLGVGILGLIVGQFVDWCNIQLPDEKSAFTKEFFTKYLKNINIKYSFMIIMSLLYLAIFYRYGFDIKTIAYLILSPMIMSAFIIDYKFKIIPNRLNLTIFETGILFTFVEGIFNINIAIDMLLGMAVGAGIFLIITLIGGLIAGKEAMGFGDVKLMGALGLFFGWRLIIIISLLAFLMGAIVGILLIIFKHKDSDAYMPFGPFIVISTVIAMLVPFNMLFIITLKIFTLGTWKV